jgi:hypothetical protein
VVIFGSGLYSGKRNPRDGGAYNDKEGVISRWWYKEPNTHSESLFRI